MLKERKNKRKNEKCFRWQTRNKNTISEYRGFQRRKKKEVMDDIKTWKIERKKKER